MTMRAICGRNDDQKAVEEMEKGRGEADDARKRVEIDRAFDHASMSEVLTDTKSTAMEENLAEWFAR